MGKKLENGAAKCLQCLYMFQHFSVIRNREENSGGRKLGWLWVSKPVWHFNRSKPQSLILHRFVFNDPKVSKQQRWKGGGVKVSGASVISFFIG